MESVIPDAEPADAQPTRRVRPVFLLLLGLVVLAVVAVAAFLVGYRAGQLPLTAADRAHLEGLQKLADDAPSIQIGLKSTDERARMAFFLQRTVATDLTAYGNALLLSAGDEPPMPDRRNEYFRRSSDLSLSPAERDRSFMPECVAWSEALEGLMAPARVERLSSRLRPLMEEFRDAASEVGRLCRSA